MSDLWSGRRAEARERAAPLAWRMRPRTLDEFEGQEHIVGEGKLLRRMIESGAMTSIILHGPPGTGKTTLAEVIAHATDRAFERENAASVGVKRIREIIDEAATRLETGGKRTILFLDEIHRFSKSQQDVLLGDVERGMITLIGATTENPMFSVNSALVSRSTLFRLEPLSEDDVVRIVKRAAGDVDRGYGRLNLTIDDDALRVWAIKSDGDARRALTALEVAVLSKQREGSAPHISKDDAEQSIQQKAVVYAPGGDEHYDSISAMIKSVRGSDPDAAVYWIARMLEGGEDPNFIARRLAILASEDIGNADPRGIQVAAAAWELVERIGMPEARITLSQCAIYLALAPKSNASYVAINEAMSDVKEGRTIPVPIFLQSGHKAESVGDPRFAKGKEQYEYTHDTKANTSIGGVSGQDYLGVDKEYYRPTDRGLEQKLKERLEEVRRVRRGEA
jgi:putative ATPase